MKKLLLLLSALILTFGLAACDDDSDNANAKSNEANASNENTENNEENEATANNEENADENENVEESEVGKMSIIYKKKELDVTEESGPFALEVKALQIGDLKVADDYKEFFDDKDEATIVTVNMEVENTEDATNSFYPDQATLTTNTGEQVEADMFFSDDVGGEFMGEVKKDGDIFFILDSDAEEIDKVTLHIDAPHDEDFENIGEELKIELEVE